MNKMIDNLSAEVIHDYIKKFNERQDLTIVEEVLSELFEKYPNNQNLRDILIKVTTLNALFSTNIFAIVEVSKHILVKDIDENLRANSLRLINEISVMEIGGKVRNNYSFATKYCHWHRPETYPIYDSYVSDLLWKYAKRDRFMNFSQSDFRDYPKYKQILERFRGHYGLSQFTTKELDKFLWLHGRELSRN